MFDVVLHRIPITLTIYGKKVIIDVQIACYNNVNEFLKKLKTDNEDTSLVKDILCNTEKKVFEPRWEVIMDESSFSKKEKTFIIYQILKIFKKIIKDFAQRQENSGCYVVTKPEWEDLPNNAKKREFLSTYNNMSPIKKDGFCYAVVNEFGDLSPL